MPSMGSRASSPIGMRSTAVYIPKIQAAETAKDATAYYLALREFSWAFNDGHVGVNGGNPESQVFSEATAGGYGFAIRETESGKVIVTYRDAGWTCPESRDPAWAPR